MSDKTREEFEAAWRRRYPDHEEIAFKRSLIEPGSYVATRVKDAWWAWQASRSAVVIDLGMMTNNGFDGFYPANQVKRALRDAGVTTK